MTTSSIPLYQIDAFTNQVFKGNPAAVCPLKNWLPDELLFKIAQENNLSETAFFIPSHDKEYDYEIRWFTPKIEVPLCGHATLASAFVIFNILNHPEDIIIFKSLSGLLTVKKTKSQIHLYFPARDYKKITLPQQLIEALNLNESDIIEVFDSTHYLIIVKDEKFVLSLSPNFNSIADFTQKGVIVSAQSNKEHDFVSRMFAPGKGVNEDPVTGAAHCILTPYWSKKLNKKKLLGYQASGRGGYIHCQKTEEHIILSGEASLYLEGQIYIDDKS